MTVIGMDLVSGGGGGGEAGLCSRLGRFFAFE